MIQQTESNKIRYEMRNEIENIVKEYHIDRTPSWNIHHPWAIFISFPKTIAG